MSPKRKTEPVAKLIAEWTIPPAATLGSSVRAKGILLEMRARLPSAIKKSLDVTAGILALRMPKGADTEFSQASSLITKAMVGIEALPVIPREIEDILTIKTSERHRWLKDGRLPSAGTRTVKLRGRAKKITFHVFDPRRVEEILDRDLVSVWREEDAETAAENRRKAAWKRRLARADKNAPADGAAQTETADEGARPRLAGWEEFEREGLLR